MSKSTTYLLSLDAKASLDFNELLQQDWEFKNWTIREEWKARSTSATKSTPVKVSYWNLGTWKVEIL